MADHSNVVSIHPYFQIREGKEEELATELALQGAIPR